jgi:hypothetical protein
MAATGWTTGASAGFREHMEGSRNDRIDYTYEFPIRMRESDEMQISVAELQKSRLVSSPGRPRGFC